MVKLKPAKDYLKAFYAIRPDALCYQENDIILGLAYLNRLAEQEQMPLVICLAWGQISEAITDRHFFPHF